MLRRMPGSSQLKYPRSGENLEKEFVRKFVKLKKKHESENYSISFFDFLMIFETTRIRSKLLETFRKVRNC